MSSEVTPIAVAIVSRAGSYLIGRRPSNAPLGGLWEFPGGKVRPGETTEAAAARECEEETGLATVVVAPFPDVLHEYEHGRLRLHFFACTPLDPTAEPKPPFRWVAAAQLAEYEFPAANAALVQHLIQKA